MAPERKSFFACNAFLHKITGKYTCDVWLWNDWKNPIYDPALALPIDLEATPSRSWATASVDDYTAPPETHITRGLTTLGPSWPNSTRVAGREHAAEAGVYLETTLWRRAREEVVTRSNGEKTTRMPVWPPGDSQQSPILRQPYRYECVVIKNDDGSLPRYFGFHAKVAFPPANNEVVFEVYLANDTGLDAPTLVRVALDNRDQCDPIDWSKWTNDSNVGSVGPLYLRWKYASSPQIGLSSPKLPYGLGAAGDLREGLTRSDLREEPISVTKRVETYVPRTPQQQAGSFVSISHDNPDDELLAIQRAINGKSHIVDDRWGVEAMVRILRAMEHRESQTFDLVAHSTAIALILDFDGWQIRIDPELAAFCSRVRGQMSRFKELRLIGCATAGSAEGQAAMSALQSELGIPVFGTSAIVYSANFAAGYYDGSALVAAGSRADVSLAIPDGARIPDPGRDALRYRLGALPEPRVPRVFSSLHIDEFCDVYIDANRVAYLPGLLTRPLVELIIDRDEDLLFAEVLFDWRLLRVKLDAGTHAVFRITNPDGLRNHIIDNPRNKRAFRYALQLA